MERETERMKSEAETIESLQAQLAEAKECQALADDILKSKNEIVGTLEYELDEIKQERDKLQALVKQKDKLMLGSQVQSLSNRSAALIQQALELSADSLPPFYTEEEVRPLVEALKQIGLEQPNDNRWFADKAREALSTLQRKERG